MDKPRRLLRGPRRRRDQRGRSILERTETHEAIRPGPRRDHVLLSATLAPGRNLPRSLRTSPRPVPNFGANGRGKRPSAPDAATKPAAAAAADAIDAVRAVADVSVYAVVDAGPTPSSRWTSVGHFAARTAAAALAVGWLPPGVKS